MANDRERAVAILGGMLAPAMAGALASSDEAMAFGGEIRDLAMGNVFERLWTRDALDLRTRSLITVAMLIALRASEELAIHIPAAVRNGATLAELEEVIYHATGYAGFPAANSARTIAEEALRKAGMLPASG